jgi:hypothetical protein
MTNSNPDLRGLLRLDQAAAHCGFTKGSFANYVCGGLMPPPRVHVGSIPFFDRRDLDHFMKRHRGRPNARKSVKARAPKRR